MEYKAKDKPSHNASQPATMIGGNIFVYLLLCAVPGNLAVMVAVCLPELRTPRNILVSSLAFSDLLFAVSIPLTVMDAATLSWLLPPSLHLCR